MVIGQAPRGPPPLRRWPDAQPSTLLSVNYPGDFLVDDSHRAIKPLQPPVRSVIASGAVGLRLLLLRALDPSNSQMEGNTYAQGASHRGARAASLLLALRHRFLPPSNCKTQCTEHAHWPEPGLCLVILGGGGQIAPPGFWLTHPPTHPHQKIFPQEKNEIYQRGPNLGVDFRYTNFFLASDPPPPGIVSTSH